MPALTISTDIPPQRSSSPTRPPISPITPPLAATRLPDGPSPRQTFTHSQPDQVGISPPAPEPIAFDSNPDVIALRSAISVLQVQRQRATGDIQALSKIKGDAVDDPQTFLRDLADGKVKARPDGLSQSYDSEEDDDDDEESSSKMETDEKAWESLPKPQNVVRCPPVNWSQYAVVGESLDKLHAEQVSRPTQGTPAVIGSGGMYEFKGGEGTQEKYPGVAAPYAPGRDKLDKKSKGKK